MKLKFAMLIVSFFILPISSMASEFCVIVSTSGGEDMFLFYKGSCTSGKTLESDSVAAINPFYIESRMQSVLTKLLAETAAEGFTVVNDLSGEIQRTGQQKIVIAKGVGPGSQICTTSQSQLVACTKNVTSLPFSYDLIKSKKVDADWVLGTNGFKNAGESRVGNFGLLFFQK